MLNMLIEFKQVHTSRGLIMQVHHPHRPHSFKLTENYMKSAAVSLRAPGEMFTLFLNKWRKRGLTKLN